MDDKTLVAMVESQMQDDQIDYHDDGYIAIVLKMMGLMCDNQNETLQVFCNSMTCVYVYVNGRYIL